MQLVLIVNCALRHFIERVCVSIFLLALFVFTACASTSPDSPEGAVRGFMNVLNEGNPSNKALQYMCEGISIVIPLKNFIQNSDINIESNNGQEAQVRVLADLIVSTKDAGLKQRFDHKFKVFKDRGKWCIDPDSVKGAGEKIVNDFIRKIPGLGR